MSTENETSKPFDSKPVLATLKDFQLQTVEHVFERMYGPSGVDRFLVADEVGLGKTLVAKGIVAKVVEQLSKDPGHRIDIVYLCANRDIASQNIDRLNLFGEERVSEANRLTLLPLHLQKLQGGPNFIAFTPGTALNLKGATGVATERALLYWMVRQVWQLEGKGLRNFFQVGVKNDNWDWAIDDVGGQIDELEGGEIDEGVRERFLDELSKSNGLRARLDSTLQKFQRRRDKPGNVPYEDRSQRDQLIGEMRECLARACLTALEPDLIILDEFQRFSSLLDSGKSDKSNQSEEREQVAALGQQFLAYKGAKILLLSATPYKAYTLAGEGAAEDHHENFLRTAGFLLKDPQKICELKDVLTEFSQALFDDRPTGNARLAAAKGALETRLRQHIVRTERLAVTADRDGMIEEMSLPACRLEHQDLEAFGALDNIARALEQADVVEYWKSAPYLLNFMERDGYELKRSLLEGVESGELPDIAPSDLRKVTLQASAVAKFDPLDPQNSRLRALVEESLDRGAWKVLWIPPTLPYYVAKGTPYDEALAQSLTKILVFSNWRFVPRAIAGMLSYEAERRIAALADEQIRYDGLSTRSRRGLLRFAVDENGPRDLNSLTSLYPSPVLCELIDPLEEAKQGVRVGAAIEMEALRGVTEGRVQELLQRLSGGTRTAGDREDQRWYMAAMLRTDHIDHSENVNEWLNQRPGWSSFVPANDEGDGAPGAFRAHVELFGKLGTASDLGKLPADLHQVLAKVALGSPSVVALRSLRRLTKALGVAGYPAWLLDAAARIGIAFRSLFNQPDATVLTRALYKETDESRYWEAMLDHCIAGNLQAVMDEHVHILREAVGVADKPPKEAVTKIAAEIVTALSMRATVLRVDDLRADPDLRLMSKTIGFRCRSALRFDTDASEDGSGETRADQVRVAFNSPFRPFVMATTAVGQEGLDFHLWCHAVFHWHLPSNPVDFEQREGRVHRYKGHVIRRSIASALGLIAVSQSAVGTDPWETLFEVAKATRSQGQTDLIPYWVFNGKGDFKIRRYIPALPLSRERAASIRLRASLGVYRMVFGQPRQEDLLAFLQSSRGVTEQDASLYGIDLAPQVPMSKS